MSTRFQILYSAIVSAIGSLAVAGFSLSVEAAESKPRAVGAGIAYPGQNEAVYVNPTGLVEGGEASLLGLWLGDSEGPYISLSGSYGVAGLGFAYAAPNGINRMYAGFGVELGGPLLGVSLVSSSGNNVNGDLGLTFPLGDSLRLAAVARGLESGVDRVDVGLGTKMGAAFIELDVKKPLQGSNTWFFDLGIAVAVQKFSFSVGSDFAFYEDGSFNDPDIHAAVDLRLAQSLAVHAAYRPSPQEFIGGNEWAVGARYSF